MAAPKKELIEQLNSIGYLTPKQACMLANVAENTVCGWAQTGDVDSIRKGMFLFVSEKDVKKLMPKLEERKARAAPTRKMAMVVMPENEQRKSLLTMLRDPIVREEMHRIVNEGIIRFTTTRSEE